MKKIVYKKHENGNLFECMNLTTRKFISVKIYGFTTSIDIHQICPSTKFFPTMLDCTKFEFDKAFNLALACISNKTTNA